MRISIFVIQMVVSPEYPNKVPRVYIEQPEHMKTGPRAPNPRIDVLKDAERLRIVGQSVDGYPEISVKFKPDESLFLLFKKAYKWCTTIQEEWQA